MTALLDRPVVYKPQEGFQTEIHTRLEDIVTIGGKKGPGKTHGMIGESLRQIDNPHYHGIFFRRVFPSLQEIIDRAHQMFPQLGARWIGDLKRYVFPSHAVVDFSHLENEEDKRKHNGKEYTAEFFDQLEEFTETQFDYLLAQNRTSHPGLRCYVMASHNPGGIGNVWINRRFVRGKIPGKTYVDEIGLPDGRKVRRTTCFIRGDLFENKILLQNNPQYLATLMLLPEKLRKAFMDGNYDILEGQYFETWSSATHLIEPFAIDSEYKIYMAMDWGYKKPMSVGWWAVSPDAKHCYKIREYYETLKLSSVAAQEIHEINMKMFGEHYIRDGRIYAMFCDPSVFTKNGQTGKSIAEDFQAVFMEKKSDGTYSILPLRPSKNDRIPGWNIFRNMLSIQPDGKPFAMWFNTCNASSETIPTLVHDENKPEDLDTDGEDHAADEARYFFIERFGPNKQAEKDPLEHLKGNLSSYREWQNVNEKLLNPKPKSYATVMSRVGT